MAVAVKICGIQEFEDAKVALEAGADYLGFVLEPSSPRYVGSTDWAPEWLSDLPLPKVAVYGDFNGDPCPAFDVIQSVGWNRLPPTDMRHFRVLRIGEKSQEVFHVNLRAGDAVVLDAYDSNVYGGTGKAIDWNIAADIVRRLEGVRVFLAGGLTSENVQEAIRIVNPFGVDVSSGVESSPGVKDHKRIEDFIRVAKQFL